MNETHRKTLRENRTFVIENVANPLDVVEQLFEKNIFTESMKQDVEAEKTTHGKTRKILDTLSRRGPHAFDKFCESLLETSNETVAEGLNPALQGAGRPPPAGQRGIAIPQPQMVLPDDWPNEIAMKAPVEVEPCNVQGALVRDKWINENVYSMKKGCRGRCVIIANKVFSGPLATDEKGNLRVQLSNRHGTEQDEERLELLFKQLLFDVVMHKEKTAEEMLVILQEEARQTEVHLAAECFVCVVCSHGTEKGVYGIDGRVLTLNDLTSCMDGEHCRALREKPKLFFIQACQGEKADTPSDLVDSGQDLNMVFQQLNVTDAKKADDMPTLQGAQVPTKVDMLIACATHPGYVSLRNTLYGSWFIQAVIYVFQKYAHKEDITSLLTLVNRLVSKGRTSQNDQDGSNITQACLYQSSLTKTFFFFPGVAADS